MKEVYCAVYQGGSGEIVEKKSRFIATVRPVASEEEALRFIEEIKKKYWDARHNCYAFVVGENMELQRFSDDGEPSGTAGKPMLDVMLGQKIHDAAVVVTRYFGGTLLGTGGLVKAYTRAVKAGLENSVIIEKTRGVVLEVQTDYNGLGKIQYLAAQNSFDILDSEYTQEVVMRLLIPVSKVESAEQAITEITGGKGRITVKQELYFAKNGKELLIFES